MAKTVSPSRRKPAARKQKTSKSNAKKEHPPTAKKSAPAENADRFPIVGIGASAGGFESVMTLLRALPGDTGMAFVVLLHLEPKHSRKLGDLISRAKQMRV